MTRDEARFSERMHCAAEALADAFVRTENQERESLAHDLLATLCEGMGFDMQGQIDRATARAARRR